MSAPSRRKGKGSKIGARTVYENQTFDEIQKAQIMEFVEQEFSRSVYPCPSNFESDWSDGIALIRLLETLTNQKFKRYCRKPKLQIQKMDNINIVISFMESYYRIQVFGFTPKEVVKGNEKQIVGLLFLLMTHVKKLRGDGESGGSKIGRRWRKKGGGDWEKRSDDEDDDTCSTVSSSCASPRSNPSLSPRTPPQSQSSSFSGIRKLTLEKITVEEKPKQDTKITEDKEKQQEETKIPTLPPLPTSPPPAITPSSPPPTPPTALPTARSPSSPTFSSTPSSPSQEVCGVIYAAVQQWAPKQTRTISGSKITPPPGVYSPSRDSSPPGPRSPSPSPLHGSSSPYTPRNRSPLSSRPPQSPPFSSEQVQEHISAAVKEWEGESSSRSTSPNRSPSLRSLSSRSPSKNRTSSLFSLGTSTSSTSTPASSSSSVSSLGSSSASSSSISPSSPSLSRAGGGGGSLKSPSSRRRAAQGAPIKSRLSTLGSFARLSTLTSPKEAPRKKEGEGEEEEQWEIDGLSDSEESEEEGEEGRERRTLIRVAEVEVTEGDRSDEEEMTLERFVEKWGERKGNKEGCSERLSYLYSCFGPGREKESLLLRLQAVARRLAIQRAYKSKINRRNKIANEILETERSYVKSLQKLVTVFQEPLIAKQCVKPETVRAIFGTISPILGTAESLLKELEERMSAWYSEGQRIGDIFQKYVSIFKIYTDYVNNYNTSLEKLSDLKKNNPGFRTVMKEGMKKCEGHDVNSFLVLPIQRIPRYVMFMEELSKYTPISHPDYEPLQQVVVDMRGVAEYVNERKRAAENQLQVAKCMEQISGITFQLISPSRKYYDEGFLYEKSAEKKTLKNRYIFLFNNLLLITSLKKGSGGAGGTIKGGPPGKEGGGGVGAGGSVGRKKGGSLGKKGGQVVMAGGGSATKSPQTPGRGSRGTVVEVGAGAVEGELFQYNRRIDFQNVELYDVEGGGEEGGMEYAFGVKKNAGAQEKFNHIFCAPDQKRKDRWMKNIDQGISETLECDVSRLCLVAGVEERSSVKVKKEGILKVMGSSGKWHRRKIILSNGILEVQTVRSVVKERLLLGGCTVRMMEVSDRRFSFRLSNSAQLVVLAADSNSKRFEWINGIRESIRQIMAYQERLKENPGLMVKELVGKGMGNERCADCNKQEIAWANLAAGVFVCRLCGSIHRTLTHTMKLKPVERCGHWTVEEVLSMKQRGNQKSGKELEEKVEPEYEKPAEMDPHSKKVAYIEHKYRHFIPNPSVGSPTPNSPPTSPPTSPSSPSASSPSLNLSPSPPPSSPSNNIITSTTSAPTSPNPSFSCSSPPSSSSPLISPLPLAASPSRAQKRRTLPPSPLSPRSQKKEEGGGSVVGSEVRRGLMEMKRNEEWEYYFVSLMGNRLVYHDAARQKKGEVVLDMAAVFCEMNSEKMYTFKLVTLTKQYLFACSTEDEMIQWVKWIQRSCESGVSAKKKRLSLRF